MSIRKSSVTLLAKSLFCTILFLCWLVNASRLLPSALEEVILKLVSIWPGQWKIEERREGEVEGLQVSLWGACLLS